LFVSEYTNVNASDKERLYTCGVCNRSLSCHDILMFYYTHHRCMCKYICKGREVVMINGFPLAVLVIVLSIAPTFSICMSATLSLPVRGKYRLWISNGLHCHCMHVYFCHNVKQFCICNLDV